MGMLDMVDAVRLNKENKALAEDLRAKYQALEHRALRLQERYGDALELHFDNELAPFALAFSKIKNCTLEDLDVLGRVPEVADFAPETRDVSFHAMHLVVSSATGLAAGAGAGAVTFAAVGALATASTGTAISTLSGAAATSATLAWLGGGSLAAGGLGVAGGTMVLTGLVAVPVVLASSAAIWWAGSKELGKQRELAAELESAKAMVKRDKKLIKNVKKNVERSTMVLRRLGREVSEMNGWLQYLQRSTTDYRDFSEEDKERLAVHVALALAMTAVMSSPLVIDGTTVGGTTVAMVNPDFGAQLDAAESVLSRDELQA